MVGFLDFMSWLCHESDSRLSGVSELVFSANSSSDRQRNRNNGTNIVKAEKRAKSSSFRPNWPFATYNNQSRSGPMFLVDLPAHSSRVNLNDRHNPVILRKHRLLPHFHWFLTDLYVSLRITGFYNFVLNYAGCVQHDSWQTSLKPATTTYVNAD